MCQFVSWIEKQGKTKQILFLTKPLIESKKGKELLAGLPSEDLIGHGAIRRFFGLERDEGVDKECTEFSAPAKFPDAIVKAIKRGDMAGYPFPAPRELFTQEAIAKMKAYAEWKKADAERKKADAEWWKADAERNKADAERWKADAEWWKADAEWWKADAERWKADAEWKKADAERKKAENQILWSLFADPANRNPVWR